MGEWRYLSPHQDAREVWNWCSVRINPHYLPVVPDLPTGDKLGGIHILDLHSEKTRHQSQPSDARFHGGTPTNLPGDNTMASSHWVVCVIIVCRLIHLTIIGCHVVCSAFPGTWSVTVVIEYNRLVCGLVHRTQASQSFVCPPSLFTDCVICRTLVLCYFPSCLAPGWVVCMLTGASFIPALQMSPTQKQTIGHRPLIGWLREHIFISILVYGNRSIISNIIG